MNRIFSLSLLLVLLAACQPAWKDHELQAFEYPSKVDTSDHPITLQDKKAYVYDELTVDNLFEGARLNGFDQISATEYEALIAPENKPINPSPWYAFRIYNAKPATIDLYLQYEHGKHRYWPKYSTDRENWTRIDSTAFEYVGDSSIVKLSLDVGTDTLYVSGQELLTSSVIKSWTEEMASNTTIVSNAVYGQSRLGRDLLSMDISVGEEKAKPIVLIIGRQHPPEVTGQLAMFAFVEEILNGSQLSGEFLENFRVLVYPMLNPDGVDLGHWRHNEGGIDTNRDWAYHRQPEIKQVMEDILKKVNAAQAEVKIGFDFHSTQHDIYYTLPDSIPTNVQGFSPEWISRIEAQLPEHQTPTEPSPPASPVSKAWFHSMFGAEAITYEFGDHTPRDIIKKKSEISAREMMKILLERKP